MRATDQTPTGIRLEGLYENDRNAESSDSFKMAIREVYGVQDVICAHHLVYVREDKRADGFNYQVVEEIPSADALLFDHEAAKILWGDTWRAVLTSLALEPVETRDALFCKLLNARPNHAGTIPQTV